MKLVIDAEKDNLEKVCAFVDEELQKYSCEERIINRINIAIEEIYVNIANYAYGTEGGKVEVICDIIEEPLQVEITFIDCGIAFNPLAHADPDVTLKADDREIGGLGILMTKKLMDDVKYEYVDRKNVLKIMKKLK